MPSTLRNRNPFALMIDPQAVLAQIAHSERLERLHRRVCRPLDRPLLAHVGADDAELDTSDADAAEAEQLGADDDGQAPEQMA